MPLKPSSNLIIGNSPQVQSLIQMLEKVAPSKTSVLIIGESGTGKELVAKMLHTMSPLKDKPFVPINCGAIPETLIESELFGHKKGSFTGAVSEKTGLFETATGGSLFLDEIGELPLSMQVKLLRAIQDRQIRRVGGNDSIKIDVRIIAATNRNLELAIQKGTFREDLYYRLNVIQIKTPPLREREGDVDVLIQFFLDKFNQKQGKSVTGFDHEAKTILDRYPWPGNVRELENLIERVVTLSNDAVVPASAFPSNILNYSPISATQLRWEDIVLPDLDLRSPKWSLEATLHLIQKQLIKRSYQILGKDLQKTAEALKLSLQKVRDSVDS